MRRPMVILRRYVVHSRGRKVCRLEISEQKEHILKKVSVAVGVLKVSQFLGFVLLILIDIYVVILNLGDTHFLMYASLVEQIRLRDHHPAKRSHDDSVCDDAYSCSTAFEPSPQWTFGMKYLPLKYSIHPSFMTHTTPRHRNYSDILAALTSRYASLPAGPASYAEAVRSLPVNCPSALCEPHPAHSDPYS